MIPNAAMAEEEWTTPEIDWRYFAYAASPIIAAHAKEVTNNREDKEYRHSTPSVSRTLCQKTQRSTLVNLFDVFEGENKTDA
jgi:hypothetical protein